MNTSITHRADQFEPRIFSFWSNLSLQLKLMLAFGILFIFTLTISIFTLWGMSRTQTSYRQALAEGVEMRNVANHLTEDFDQAQSYKQSFLLHWKSEGYDTAYTNYVVAMQNTLAETQIHFVSLANFVPLIKDEGIKQADYEKNLATITQGFNTYEQSFIALAAALKERGANETSGMEAILRNSAHTIENQIANKPGLEQLEITYLQLRRHEKDYLARGGQTYIDDVHTTIAELKAEISVSELIDPTQKTNLRATADEYLVAFNALVEKDQEIATIIDQMDSTANTVDPLVHGLSDLGTQLASNDISKAQTDSQQTLTVSIIITLIALGLSIFLAIILSRQITRPVLQLTRTAEEIAGGNFEAHAEVLSGDEVGTLAQTFNTMTRRLNQAFEDVRRRALAVQTSAEVSRRLTIATNPGQLALDVVEQVQAAFHYYHTHIYFKDETTGDLIMVGGTGEAGATMLARGHKVSKGSGLVGRAAETNTPVLVPDVSQAEGWLPNPLLPDTKSETAIPITSGKNVLGVLDVQQNVVNGLSDEDVELLQSLAGQIAISYQNTRAFQQSRAEAELESLVNTIGQKIQRTVTVEETLQTAIRELGNALGATRVQAQLGMNYLHKNNPKQN